MPQSAPTEAAAIAGPHTIRKKGIVHTKMGKDVEVDCFYSAPVLSQDKWFVRTQQPEKIT